MLMNRTLIVSKVLAGQGLRVNFFQKIIIIILRLNYSHNYVLVASALKQRQSYNRNVNPRKWMLIVVECCHWWAITRFLTHQLSEWPGTLNALFFLPPPPTYSDMILTNHFSPKQITVKGRIVIGADSSSVEPICLAISTVAKPVFIYLTIHAVERIFRP